MIRYFDLQERLKVGTSQIAYLVFVLILPAVSLVMISEIIFGDSAKAWDGSAHWAIGKIYSSDIFPNTSGWTFKAFGGMPFPNFYPPSFFWLIAFIDQKLALPFDVSIRIWIAGPTLLIPHVIWRLTSHLSDNGNLTRIFGSIACLFLLIDQRFSFALPAGLDYFSTFQIGLYSQPLGFVFLVLWMVALQGCHKSFVRFALTTILLSATVLTNVFAGTVAALFGIVSIGCSAFRYSRFGNDTAEAQKPKILLCQVVSAILAIGLVAFWVLPMLNQYDYFVTRPYTVELVQLITPAWIVWFLLAMAGSYVWLQSPTRMTAPYLLTCAILAFVVVFASTVAPGWMPLQSPRYLTFLNFFLIVPVAYSLSFLFKYAARLLGEIGRGTNTFAIRDIPYTTGITVFVIVVLAISTGVRWGYGFAFYVENEAKELERILEFAKNHTDGRYLVEVINPQVNFDFASAAFEARAINAYLVSNGNETISAVYHEASPHSLFSLPVTNSFSDYNDSFGISSILSDDESFYRQSSEDHIARAKLLGTKYLVIRTPERKKEFERTRGLTLQKKIGFWSIFSIDGPPRVATKLLEHKPALVFSDFTLKARHRNDSSYIRWVEEQFNDGWFDVQLARSEESRIDAHSQEDLGNFGAIILEEYEYSDLNIALNRLIRFSETGMVIAIKDNSELFELIEAKRTSFKNLVVIENLGSKESGPILDSNDPRFDYSNTEIRRTWRKMREVLDRNKIPVTNSAKTQLKKAKNRMEISLDSENSSQKPVPVVVANTFHPNWSRTDGQKIYTTTPFNQLTFADQSFEIRFERRPIEVAAVWVSFGTLLLLLVGCVGELGYRSVKVIRNKKSAVANLDSENPIGQRREVDKA